MEGPAIDVNVDIPDSPPDFIIRKITHKPPQSSDPVPETKRVLPRIEIPPDFPSLLLHHLRTREIRKNELILRVEEIAGLVVHERWLNWETGRGGRSIACPGLGFGRAIVRLGEGEDDVSWRWVAEFIDLEAEVFGEVGEEAEGWGFGQKCSR